MGKYEEILEARQIFGIGESETLTDIKRKIKTLLKQWHPDTGHDPDGEREKKTVVLLRAQRIITEYCDHYKISFSRRDIEKYLSPGERWVKNFGDDHIWGGNA